ncbi:hypothetical protein V5E97_21075 [Singulisphaera sp. Ch08]|uniref:Uncharacterized protein n=1 Tax=Singulisphaera sp. Ch08 TaxID=3120278 RepID=A0AAU7C773_9BACT
MLNAEVAAEDAPGALAEDAPGALAEVAPRAEAEWHAPAGWLAPQEGE